MARPDALDTIYSLLDELEATVGGKRKLGDCDGRMNWPDRGIYFFFHPDQTRSETDQLRLTRIGTHAVSDGSSTSLWNRLRTHRGAQRGSYEGGGNHRGSVFRKRVGEAIIERDNLHAEYPEWGGRASAARELRMEELDLERRVSKYIRELPFLWVDVDDKPSPESDRAYIERNMIALVSNIDTESIDPRREDWLGHHSPVTEIEQSGLWNINHAAEDYQPEFLETFESYINRMPGVA